MQMVIRYSAIIASLFLSLTCQNALAGGKMDSQRVYAGDLSKGTAIHVHPFSTDKADLGKPKFHDTATAMAKAAPHLLATDIVETLRNAGFTAVTLDESEGHKSPDAINVTGRFTRLDPGSQHLRIWIGLGAGKSKVCISGEVTDSGGNKLADFADCRNGLGWGSSAPQGEKGDEILGARLAGFIIDWAE